MTASRWLRAALAAGILACSDDPADPGETDGFRVTAVEPVDGATDVSWNATFGATLSADIDPATLLPGTVKVTLEGTPVPAVIVSPPGGPGRTIGVVAPLLPGATYRVELTTGIHSTDGEPLAEGAVWTATTRAWQPVGPLSGAGEMANFAFAIDPSGNPHAFGDGEDRPYSDYATPYRKYVACSESCTDPASWGRMAVDSAWEPLGGAALKVDAAGRVHLLHTSRLLEPPGAEATRYGTCASDCLNPGNWAIVSLDGFGSLTGFTLDQTGRLHLVTNPEFFGSGEAGLRYSTCEQSCTDLANWVGIPIPAPGVPFDAARSLRVGSNGALHLITYDAGVTRYSTCPSNCLSPAGWSSVPDEWPGADGIGPSLAVDAGGRVHLVFNDPTRAFIYARCDGDCADPSSWATVRLDEAGSYGSALTVDDSGRITALNPVQLSGDLHFLTCIADCLETASWQIASVDHPDIFRYPDIGPPRLALGPQGQVRMIYNDAARTLRYFE